MFDVIGDGVVVSDSVGRVKWVNKAAEHILGKAKSTMIGQPLGTIYGEIDSGEPIEDLVVAFSRRNHPLPTFIETNDRAIQGRLIPWRNEEREWMGIIAVFRDVTREVKADWARNDFIAALSRELRAPLTSIKGYSELITQGMMDEYSPEQMRVFRIINSSAERIKEVLDNAIRISAQNRHQILPRFEEIDPQKIISQALREITPLAQVRELELIQEIKTSLPPLTADARHLRRIVDNLLSNACRFTPPGGRVTLRAWVQSEREGDQTRDHFLLAVADNGVGIPPAEAKRIFDPFYQVDNQDRSVESGMGMGLAVVKELVQLHNGRVWVESTPGEGSIFQVSLPLTQEY
jgi:signal transduction histidine kinase